jgi:hypothetical protein
MSSKRLTIILLLFLFIGEKATAQNKIDTFINRLHNYDAVSALWMVAPKKTFDSGKIYAHTIERVLENVDIDHIKKTYPKYLLFTRLVQALDDSVRDWIADLLLYRLTLTEISSINIVGCDNRGLWLRKKYDIDKTYKEVDVEMWHKYLAGLSDSAKW